jgi:hypothetical protein
MQFSLTPLIGYQLDISTFVLRLRRSNTGSPTGSGPTGWSLRSSLDGFATDIATGTMTYNYADYTVNPGTGFLNIYTAITFRLYGYNTTTGSGGTSRFVIDNMRVNGMGYLLPVRLGAFAAGITGEKVNLSYTVYHTEKNDRYFTERSLDGINFNTLHIAEEAEDAAQKKYSYTDELSLLNGIEQLFYRMRLHNNTGADTYSDIISVKRKSKQAAIKTYISNNQLYINGIFTDGGIYQANIYNGNGQMLIHIAFAAVNGYNTFVLGLNRQVPAGAIIHLANNKGYSGTVFILHP